MNNEKIGIRKKKIEFENSKITFPIAREVIFMNTFAETELLLKTAINLSDNNVK